MDLSRWFGHVSLAKAPRAVHSLLDELVVMLDVTQPSRLDKKRSHVVDEGHGRHEHDVEILLAHSAEPEADVTIAVSQDEAVVAWLSAHEHVYADEDSADRPWTTVVVDVTAAVLRGEYSVENHYRGDHLVKTRVLDLRDDERHVSTTGFMPDVPLSWKRSRRVERRTVDFGCRQ